MAKGDDLEKRLVVFAVSVIELCNRLPKTQAGRHIGQQLLRSGTAPAPNYGEARAAESRSDFVHKLKIALKELNETNIWLKIAHRSDMISADVVQPIQRECESLSRILNASITTAKQKQPTKRR